MCMYRTNERASERTEKDRTKRRKKQRFSAYRVCVCVPTIVERAIGRLYACACMCRCCY